MSALICSSFFSARRFSSSVHVFAIIASRRIAIRSAGVRAASICSAIVGP
jgi:hypothetical protein